MRNTNTMTNKIYQQLAKNAKFEIFVILKRQSVTVGSSLSNLRQLKNCRFEDFFNWTRTMLQNQKFSKFKEKCY